MTTWRYEGITHEVTHMDKEQRAIRTACGRYEDVMRSALFEDETPTCFQCLVAPELPPDKDVQAFRSVHTRWQDAVRRCGRYHLKATLDGYCLYCGYKQSKEEL